MRPMIRNPKIVLDCEPSRELRESLRPSVPEIPKSLKKVSWGLRPRGPKKSRKSPEQTFSRLFPDFSDFFETFSRLFGAPGPEAPGDFFRTFLGISGPEGPRNSCSSREVRKFWKLVRSENKSEIQCETWSQKRCEFLMLHLGGAAERLAVKFHGNVHGELRVNFLALFCHVRLNFAIPSIFWLLIICAAKRTVESRHRVVFRFHFQGAPPAWTATVGALFHFLSLFK